MRKSLSITTTLILLCCSTFAYAEFPVKTFTICKGENNGKCPQPPDFFISCSESETPVIERECTVTEDKKQRVQTYRKSELSVKNGDKCGYTVWKAACPAPVKTFTICKGENKGNCPQPPDFFISCSESETPVIERECTVTEDKKQRVQTYRKSKLSVKNGDKCGYTVWKTDCGSNY